MDLQAYLSSMTLPLVPIPEQTGPFAACFHIHPDFGQGEIRAISHSSGFIILIADFVPASGFEKVTQIADAYLEIGQFETVTGAWQLGSRRMRPVARSLYGYCNTSKTVRVYCEAATPVRFVKVIVTPGYMHTFLQKNAMGTVAKAAQAAAWLTQNPNLPS